MRYYMTGTSPRVTLSGRAYVIRNDGVTYLSTRPVQPGQPEFKIRDGEKIYNAPKYGAIKQFAKMELAKMEETQND